ncbi:TAXI family TRAP transporter solute-binding subunit [Salinicoccus roseus]|uniref:TAXI family TRAP transporter solute-binding subunit n=1 Tax=Salinicoccus roseus TaxID=45670 RepID=A0A0C2HLY6_9STAP|nr:TAXI family TRAP transporter solute-binding subunit [Salinicoccus roseus]KIH70556.1 hypothetical protein SN16_07540 [Salinicoccus roseus]MDB0580649.1 TAXI family TRAP transporter solute-binding subunit [Salinicoccus roseus]
MKNIIYLFAALFLVLVLSACNSGDEETSEENNEAAAEAEEESESSDSESNSEPAEGAEMPSEISFASASVGGFWHTLSGSMGDDLDTVFPESNTTIVEGGSISNMIGMNNGTYALGFANAPNVIEAYEGKGDFPEPVENVSLLATMYPNTLHIVVREDSDIETVEDLAGKKVSPGTKGYSAEITFQEVLDGYGMSYDDLGGIEYTGTSDAGDLLRDGHIDAIVSLLAAPVSTVQELDTTLGVRLIPLDQEVISSLSEKNPGYLEYTIEPGTYSNIEEEVQTIAAYTVLMASADVVSEEAAYEITKMTFENKDKYVSLSSVLEDYNEEYSVENATSEFHPGAVKYYEEQGIEIE